MKRSEAVVRATPRLISAEHAIDNAYCETAILAAYLLEVRREANLSAVVGQPVVEAMTAALASLSLARAEMVRAHGGLAEVKVSIGCSRVVADGEDKPDQFNLPILPKLAAVA